MKTTILSATVALLLAACNSQPRYVVQGDIEGLEGTLYLMKGDSLVDSAAVVGGKFRFEGSAARPDMLYLLDSREGNPDKLAMQLIVEPGTLVVAGEGDPTVYRATGTPSNDAFAAYDRKSRALIEEYREEGTTDERRGQIEEEFNGLGEKAREENSGNYFGAMLLADQAYDLSGQEILDAIATFSPEMQQTELLAKLSETAQNKLKTDIGQPYIDIEQKNAAGEVVALSSIIADPTISYTLVDFWATWCGPCMGEVPYLLEVYKDYHDKGFEIYGVSFDQSRENWIDTVKERGMDWIHVSDLNGFDNQAARDYAVQGIPSNFLVDAQGTIVAKNLRGEELREKISELLD